MPAENTCRCCGDVATDCGLCRDCYFEIFFDELPVPVPSALPSPMNRAIEAGELTFHGSRFNRSEW